MGGVHAGSRKKSGAGRQVGGAGGAGSAGGGDWSPAETTHRSVARAASLLRRLSEPYMAGFGLTTTQWSILRVLDRGERDGTPAMRVAAFGEHLPVQSPSLSVTLSRMKKMGLVDSRDDRHDSRARLIVLTAQGRKLARKAVGGHAAWVADLLTGLSGPEQSKLRELADKLSENLESRFASTGSGAMRSDRRRNPGPKRKSPRSRSA